MSAGQKVVHDEAATTALIAGVPRVGERFSVEELESRFGVRVRGDVHVNHAGKCMVLVGRANDKPNRVNGGGSCMTFLRTAKASDGRAGRDGGLFGDNLLLSRSREEGYTVLYFRKVRNMLEFASRVEYDSHAFKDEKRNGRIRRNIMFKLRAVSRSASDAATSSPQGRARQRVMLVPDMVERVERVISTNHPYDSKDCLLRVLPSHVSAEDLDRVLDHLERSGKITMRDGVIRWTDKPSRSSSTNPGKDGEVENKSILAGTRFETIGEGKSPTETVG